MILNSDQHSVIMEGLAEARGAFESGNLAHARASLDFVKAILTAAGGPPPRERLPELQDTRPMITGLIEFLARRYNITVDDILGRSREARFALVRMLGYYFTVELFDPGISHTARCFVKDRGTVLYGIGVVRDRIANETPFRLEVDQLRRDLQAHFNIQGKEAA